MSFTLATTVAATSLGLLITFPLAIPFLWLLFLGGRGVGRIERSRLEVLLGVALPDPVRPLGPGSWWAHWKARFRDRARWKEIAHAFLLLPLGVLNLVALVVVWGGSAALLALPLYVGQPARRHRQVLAVRDRSRRRRRRPGRASARSGWPCVAPVGDASPLARLGAAEACWLLGPTKGGDLEAQVTQLETSRTAAVDSAEAERRRIERDLHDGAQQRLVALAVDPRRGPRAARRPTPRPAASWSTRPTRRPRPPSRRSATSCAASTR